MSSNTTPAKGPQPANKLLNISGSFVNIKVGQGPNAKTFHVHGNVIKEGSSDFLRNAVKPEWRTGRESETITLPDHTPVVFENYVRAKYIAEHYILGEELMDISFQNLNIARLIEGYKKSNTHPSLTHVLMVYESTPSGSPLRKLIVDMYVWRGNKKYDTSEFIQDFPRDFLNELVPQLMAKRPVLGVRKDCPWNVNSASYFHQEGGKDASEERDKNGESEQNVAMTDDDTIQE